MIITTQAWTWSDLADSAKDAFINADLSTLVHQFFGNVLDMPFCRISWYDLPENRIVTQTIDKMDIDDGIYEQVISYKRNFYAGHRAAFKFCFNRYTYLIHL